MSRFSVASNDITNALSFIAFYFFIQVLPNMASVMDIKAVSYDVCGVVRMVSTGLKAKVKSQIISTFSNFIHILKVLILTPVNCR